MVVGRLLLGSDPEQETVYRQRVGLDEREPNPDAWRSIERTANGHGTAIEDTPFDSAQDRLDAQPDAFCQPQTAAVEQFGHQAVFAR